MHYWAGLIGLCTTFLAIEVPLRLVFGDVAVPTPRGLDFLFTLIFALDILVQVRYRSRWLRPAGRAGERPGSGGDRSYGPWNLAIDALATLPMRFILPGSPLELLRLLKVPRTTQYLWHLRHQRIENWGVLRLALFAYCLVLAVHWLSCGWIHIQEVRPTGNVWEAYILGVYWCVSSLATVGYGDITPNTTIERLYAMGVMIVGVAIYSFAVGNVATILTGLQGRRGRYVEHMERLTAFMRHRNIQPDLQRRIRDYYTFIWDRRLGYDESTLIADLPQSLMLELSLYLKRDMIEKVPFFKGAEESLLREIAVQMRTVVYMPGDYVCKAGELGNEMFFISRGVLEVVARDGSTVLMILKEGDFFGEIAVLFDTPRTASVRAVEYCDLYALDRAAVQQILAHHPDLARHIDEVRKERQAREASSILKRPDASPA